MENIKHLLINSTQPLDDFYQEGSLLDYSNEKSAKDYKHVVKEYASKHYDIPSIEAHLQVEDGTALNLVLGSLGVDSLKKYRHDIFHVWLVQYLLHHGYDVSLYEKVPCENLKALVTPDVVIKHKLSFIEMRERMQGKYDISDQDWIDIKGYHPSYRTLLDMFTRWNQAIEGLKVKNLKMMVFIPDIPTMIGTTFRADLLYLACIIDEKLDGSKVEYVDQMPFTKDDAGDLTFESNMLNQFKKTYDENNGYYDDLLLNSMAEKLHNVSIFNDPKNIREETAKVFKNALNTDSKEFKESFNREIYLRPFAKPTLIPLSDLQSEGTKIVKVEGINTSDELSKRLQEIDLTGPRRTRYEQLFKIMKDLISTRGKDFKKEDDFLATGLDLLTQITEGFSDRRNVISYINPKDGNNRLVKLMSSIGLISRQRSIKRNIEDMIMGTLHQHSKEIFHEIEDRDEFKIISSDPRKGTGLIEVTKLVDSQGKMVKEKQYEIINKPLCDTRIERKQKEINDKDGKLIGWKNIKKRTIIKKEIFKTIDGKEMKYTIERATYIFKLFSKWVIDKVIHNDPMRNIPGMPTVLILCNSDDEAKEVFEYNKKYPGNIFPISKTAFGKKNEKEIIEEQVAPLNKLFSELVKRIMVIIDDQHDFMMNLNEMQLEQMLKENQTPNEKKAELMTAGDAIQQHLLEMKSYSSLSQEILYHWDDFVLLENAYREKYPDSNILFHEINKGMVQAATQDSYSISGKTQIRLANPSKLSFRNLMYTSMSKEEKLAKKLERENRIDVWTPYQHYKYNKSSPLFMGIPDKINPIIITKMHTEQTIQSYLNKLKGTKKVDTTLTSKDLEDDDRKRIVRNYNEIIKKTGYVDLLVNLSTQLQHRYNRKIGTDELAFIMTDNMSNLAIMSGGGESHAMIHIAKFLNNNEIINDNIYYSCFGEYVIVKNGMYKYLITTTRRYDNSYINRWIYADSALRPLFYYLHYTLGLKENLTDNHLRSAINYLISIYTESGAIEAKILKDTRYIVANSLSSRSNLLGMAKDMIHPINKVVHADTYVRVGDLVANSNSIQIKKDIGHEYLSHIDSLPSKISSMLYLGAPISGLQQLIDETFIIKLCNKDSQSKRSILLNSHVKYLECQTLYEEWFLGCKESNQPNHKYLFEEKIKWSRRAKHKYRKVLEAEIHYAISKMKKPKKSFSFSPGYYLNAVQDFFYNTQGIDQEDSEYLEKLTLERRSAFKYGYSGVPDMPLSEKTSLKSATRVKTDDLLGCINVYYLTNKQISRENILELRPIIKNNPGYPRPYKTKLQGIVNKANHKDSNGGYKYNPEEIMMELRLLHEKHCSTRAKVFDVFMEKSIIERNNSIYKIGEMLKKGDVYYVFNLYPKDEPGNPREFGAGNLESRVGGIICEYYARRTASRLRYEAISMPGDSKFLVTQKFKKEAYKKFNDSQGVLSKFGVGAKSGQFFINSDISMFSNADLNERYQLLFYALGQMGLVPPGTAFFLIRHFELMKSKIFLMDEEAFKYMESERIQKIVKKDDLSGYYNGHTDIRMDVRKRSLLTMYNGRRAIRFPVAWVQGQLNFTASLNHVIIASYTHKMMKRFLYTNFSTEDVAFKMSSNYLCHSDDSIHFLSYLCDKKTNLTVVKDYIMKIFVLVELLLGLRVSLKKTSGSEHFTEFVSFFGNGLNFCVPNIKTVVNIKNFQGSSHYGDITSMLSQVRDHFVHGGDIESSESMLIALRSKLIQFNPVISKPYYPIQLGGLPITNIFGITIYGTQYDNFFKSKEFSNGSFLGKKYFSTILGLMKMKDGKLDGTNFIGTPNYVHSQLQKNYKSIKDRLVGLASEIREDGNNYINEGLNIKMGNSMLSVLFNKYSLLSNYTSSDPKLSVLSKLSTLQKTSFKAGFYARNNSANFKRVIRSNKFKVIVYNSEYYDINSLVAKLEKLPEIDKLKLWNIYSWLGFNEIAVGSISQRSNRIYKQSVRTFYVRPKLINSKNFSLYLEEKLKSDHVALANLFNIMVPKPSGEYNDIKHIIDNLLQTFEINKENLIKNDNKIPYKMDSEDEDLMYLSDDSSGSSDIDIFGEHDVKEPKFIDLEVTEAYSEEEREIKLLESIIDSAKNKKIITLCNRIPVKRTFFETEQDKNIYSLLSLKKTKKSVDPKLVKDDIILYYFTGLTLANITENDIQSFVYYICKLSMIHYEHFNSIMQMFTKNSEYFAINCNGELTTIPTFINNVISSGHRRYTDIFRIIQSIMYDNPLTLSKFDGKHLIRSQQHVGRKAGYTMNTFYIIDKSHIIKIDEIYIKKSKEYQYLLTLNTGLKVREITPYQIETMLKLLSNYLKITLDSTCFIGKENPSLGYVVNTNIMHELYLPSSKEPLYYLKNEIVPTFYPSFHFNHITATRRVESKEEDLQKIGKIKFCNETRMNEEKCILYVLKETALDHSLKFENFTCINERDFRMKFSKGLSAASQTLVKWLPNALKHIPISCDNSDDAKAIINYYIPRFYNFSNMLKGDLEADLEEAIATVEDELGNDLDTISDVPGIVKNIGYEWEKALVLYLIQGEDNNNVMNLRASINMIINLIRNRITRKELIYQAIETKNDTLFPENYGTFMNRSEEKRILLRVMDKLGQIMRNYFNDNEDQPEGEEDNLNDIMNLLD